MDDTEQRRSRGHLTQRRSCFGASVSKLGRRAPAWDEKQVALSTGADACVSSQPGV